MTGPPRKLVDEQAFEVALDAATFDCEGWAPLVDYLMTTFDGEGGGINIADLATGKSIAAINHGLTPAAQAEYYKHLIRKDPRIAMMAGMAGGTAFNDAALLADTITGRSEYYAWQAAQGYRDTLFIKLVHTPAELGAIAITRRNGRGAHDDDALAAARAIAPRIAGAAAVSRRIAALEGLNASLERAMAAEAKAFALFGNGAALLHANHGFRAALDRRDGLASSALVNAVIGTEADGRPRALQVRRAGQATSYRLVLQPVSPRAAEQRGFDWGRRGAVLAFLDDPDAAGSGNRAPVLQQLFGLTRAEARIAVLIADGEDIEAIAALSNVATSTVRTQLKSIFTKLGVTRQLGVARLVRGLPQFDG